MVVECVDVGIKVQKSKIVPAFFAQFFQITSKQWLMPLLPYTPVTGT